MEEMLERIKKARKAKGYTQEKLAAALDLQQTHYSRYEKGKVEMPIRILKKICQELNVSADYLLQLGAYEE